MATYRGIRKHQREGNQLVLKYSVLKDGIPLDPKPSQRLNNHSPDGFNWGYSGSGPAQLALALLLDVTNDPIRATGFYQLFKFDIIAHLPMAGWMMEGKAILAWLQDREARERELVRR